MQGLVGFELSVWDYVTFVTFLLFGAALVVLWIWVAGLPGRIAIARRHPEAEAVKLLGLAGLLPTVYPWIQAFIWAFKPTDIIDIRRFPSQEAAAIDADIARLGGGIKPEAAGAPAESKTPAPPKPADDPVPFTDKGGGQ